MSQRYAHADTNQELYLNILNISDPQLVILALKSSPQESLPVSQIYNYIEHFFPERSWRGNWKNSIRHSLSTHNTIFGSKETRDKYGHKIVKAYYILPEYNAKLDSELQKGECLLMAIRSFRGNNNVDKIATYATLDSAPYYLRTNQQNITQDEIVFCSPSIRIMPPIDYDPKPTLKKTHSKDTLNDEAGTSTEALIRKAWNRDERNPIDSRPIPVSVQRTEIRQQPMVTSYPSFRFKPAGKSMAPLPNRFKFTNSSPQPPRPNVDASAVGNLLHTKIVSRVGYPHGGLPREVRFVTRTTPQPQKNETQKPAMGGTPIPKSQPSNETQLRPVVAEKPQHSTLTVAQYLASSSLSTSERRQNVFANSQDERRRQMVQTISNRGTPLTGTSIHSPKISSMNNFSHQKPITSTASQLQMKLPVKAVIYHPYHSTQKARAAPPLKRPSYNPVPSSHQMQSGTHLDPTSRIPRIPSNSTAAETTVPPHSTVPPISQPTLMIPRPMDPPISSSASDILSPSPSFASAENAAAKETIVSVPLHPASLPHLVSPKPVDAPDNFSTQCVPSTSSGSAANSAAPETTVPSPHPASLPIPHPPLEIPQPMDFPHTSSTHHIPYTSAESELNGAAAETILQRFQPNPLPIPSHILVVPPPMDVPHHSSTHPISAGSETSEVALKASIPSLHTASPVLQPTLAIPRFAAPRDTSSTHHIPSTSFGSQVTGAAVETTLLPSSSAHLPISHPTLVIPQPIDPPYNSNATRSESIVHYTPLPLSTRLMDPPPLPSMISPSLDDPGDSFKDPQSQMDSHMDMREESSMDMEAEFAEIAETSSLMDIDAAIENYSFNSIEITAGDDHYELAEEWPMPMESRSSLLNAPMQTLSMDDISSMEILEPTEETRDESIPPRVIPPPAVKAVKNLIEQPEIPKTVKTSDDNTLRISKIVWKPAPPELKSSLLPPPAPPAPSPSIFSPLDSSPLHPNRPLIDLSKPCFSKAAPNSLPFPMKKREVQSIRLTVPVRLPAKPLHKVVQVRANETVRKIPPVMSARTEPSEVPRSQVALSLMEQSQKKEDSPEIIGVIGGTGGTGGVSRRRAEKDRAMQMARREEKSPTIDLMDDDIGIIFEGTSKKKRILFDCASIEFEDCPGFPADTSTDPLEREDEKWTRKGEDAPWKDSLVEFTIKATEKEREEERNEFGDDEMTKKSRTERRKEIAQLKMEGKTVDRKKPDVKKNKIPPFDPTVDLFIESREDAERRRQRGDYKLLMEKTTDFLKKSLPFYLHRSIDGILRESTNKRENQRIAFARVNPNANLPIVVSGGVCRSIYLHDYATGEFVSSHRPHFTYATDAAWSHCGQKLIACGTDKLVAVMAPDGFPVVQNRIYPESTPVGARFSEDGNLAFVAMENGQLDLIDLREEKGRVVRRITGIPDITCIDANPLDWSTLAIGCKNGLVTEYNFYEDHRKSTNTVYFQYFLPGLTKVPIFNNLRCEAYDDYWDDTEVKSLRYCASMDSDCADDLVVTKANRNEGRGDTAYKFSPGTNNPVVAYHPPEGFNISCATLAFNHNARHEEKYNSCENYVVAGTEEGTVIAFDAASGKMIKGGNAVIDDPSLFGNHALRYLKKDLGLARILAYTPIKKYFPHEKPGFDPDLATRLTAIDAVPDSHTGAFIVGGWGVNPNLNVYRFHDDSDIEHLLPDIA